MRFPDSLKNVKVLEKESTTKEQAAGYEISLYRNVLQAGFLQSTLNQNRCLDDMITVMIRVEKTPEEILRFLRRSNLKKVSVAQDKEQ